MMEISAKPHRVLLAEGEYCSRQCTARSLPVTMPSRMLRHCSTMAARLDSTTTNSSW